MTPPTGNGRHDLDLGGLALYEDAERGFRLRHPADWRAEPGRFGAAVGFVAPSGDLEPGTFLPSVSIVVALLEEDAELDDLARQHLDALLAALDAPEVVDEETVTLGPYVVRRHVVVHRRDDLQLALEQWIFVHEGRMATLSVTCEVADFDLVHPIGATIADELRLR